MNPAQFPLLALVLFAPWFAIVGTLFWKFPRQPRHARRRGFDAAALVVAFVIFIATTWWAFHHADGTHQLWKQVFATSVGYGSFLLAMSVAFFARRRWFNSLR
jgi:quinol-cytochrome oxidoreductase complex cytochrome b subunit